MTGAAETAPVKARRAMAVEASIIERGWRGAER